MEAAVGRQFGVAGRDDEADGGVLWGILVEGGAVTPPVAGAVRVDMFGQRYGLVAVRVGDGRVVRIDLEGGVGGQKGFAPGEEDLSVSAERLQIGDCLLREAYAAAGHQHRHHRS